MLKLCKSGKRKQLSQVNNFMLNDNKNILMKQEKSYNLKYSTDGNYLNISNGNSIITLETISDYIVL